jgi:hypothetical protein
MNLRLSLIVCALVVVLSGCNISVTSFPVSPAPPVENTGIPPTPYPDTPAPPAIAAPLIESPALLEIQFFNELDGWGVTETFIVRTNDGGITWYNVTPPDVEEMGSAVETFSRWDHAKKPDLTLSKQRVALHSGWRTDVDHFFHAIQRR